MLKLLLKHVVPVTDTYTILNIILISRHSINLTFYIYLQLTMHGHVTVVMLVGNAYIIKGGLSLK